MSAHQNINGVMHEISEIHQNINGTMHEVETGHINIGGVLKEIFSSKLKIKSLEGTRSNVDDGSRSISNPSFGVMYSEFYGPSAAYGGWARVTLQSSGQDIDLSKYNTLIIKGYCISYVNYNYSNINSAASTQKLEVSAYDPASTSLNKITELYELSNGILKTEECLNNGYTFNLEIDISSRTFVASYIAIQISTNNKATSTNRFSAAGLRIDEITLAK